MICNNCGSQRMLLIENEYEDYFECIDCWFCMDKFGDVLGEGEPDEN